MIDTLRPIIEAELEWYWSYGRPSDHNLEDAESATDSKPFFFLDPLTREFERNSKSGNRTGYTFYSGHFMILKKSDLDEVYDSQKDQDEAIGKFEKHIKPILTKTTGLYDLLEKEITCAPHDFQVI